ncbi:carbonic anhydrase [Halalkalibacterium halodurans]|uniref:carbonic anhydrase n=1 Tax=Halalkalibacterium halodurans TaxID=86665 RepID=UPI002AA97B82|nr:carbonic anhydrase [Halalkalibacterium halodurans]MDY7220856.1 carbonic anhydrase [Halalkalibacterium halodurans]MDY7240095.1 carbonic anhydrase [Halalkalibacterium halodurans]
MKKHLWGKTCLAVSLSVMVTACSSAPSTEPVDEPSETHEETSGGAHEVHWSYTGDTGPEHWAELDSEYGACAQGEEQSPINLDKAEAVDTDTEIQVHYEPSAFTIKNNGHTIQAETTSEENTIEIDGKEYTLVQFHFHIPSEHEMEGKNLDMELHFVHKNENDELAVLGVLMKAGEENEELAKLWSKLPAEETEENISLDESIDLNALLPESKEGFHYNGSLTTPPCSEGVKWTVLSEPITVSQEQIDAFAEIFPDNHRPVQPWNDRDVYDVITE